MVIYNSLLSAYKNILNVFRFAKDISEIDDIKDDIFEVFPKTAVMYKYNQLNESHQYDLWDHSAQVVVNINKMIVHDDIVLLAAFLHDIAKPICRVPDSKRRINNMHYYGHAKESAVIVADMMNKFYKDNKFKLIEDDKDLHRLYWLIYHHDDRISSRPSSIDKLIHDELFAEFLDITDNMFMQLMYLEVADAQAHVINDKIQERINICRFMASPSGLNYFKAIKYYGCNGLARINLDEYGLDESIEEKINKFISDSKNN